MKHKYIIILLIIMLLTITGCKHSKYEKTSKKEALDYISNKYNINKDDLVIYDVNILTIDHGQYNFTPDYTGYAIIKLGKSPEEEIYVQVKYDDKDTSTYSDTYQYNEIMNDLYTYYKTILNINNIEVYIPKEFLLNKGNNKKYNNNIEDYLTRINKEIKSDILIVTEDNININKLQSIIDKYPNIRILLYKVAKNNKLKIYSTPHSNMFNNETLYNFINSQTLDLNILETYNCLRDNCTKE